MVYLFTLIAAWVFAAGAQSAFDTARALQEQGRFAEAEHYYRLAIIESPGSVPAITNLGVVLARQGRYPDAIAAYKSALKIDGSATLVKVNLGIAYFQIGDCASAGHWFEEALKADPTDHRSRQLLAVCQLEIGQFQAAEQSFQQLMPSDDPSILLGIATVYLKTDRTAEAEKILNALIREHGDSPGVQAVLGIAEFAKQQYAIAAATLQAALQLEPDNADARFYLGAALFKQDNLDGAIREWRSVAKSKPGYFPAVFALGALLGSTRQNEQAKPLLRTAINLRPDHPGPYLELGKIAMHEGNYRTAVNYLEKAARLDPASKETSFLLATTFKKLGRGNEARIEFERSKKLYQQAFPDLIQNATKRH